MGPLLRGITASGVFLLLGWSGLAQSPPEQEGKPKTQEKQQAKPAERQQRPAQPARQDKAPADRQQTQQRQQQADNSAKQQQQQQARGQQNQQRQQQADNAAKQQQQQQARGQQDQQRQQRQQQSAGAGVRQVRDQQDRQRQVQTRSPAQVRQQQVAWQGARAHSWNSEHRDWQQRGGYNGYRVPDDRFRNYYGQDHGFRIYSLPVVYVGGNRRFEYGGYWFGLVDPWPEYWSSDWYDSDDVYVDYYDGGYYLYNRRHPGDRIAISFYLN
jgi:hypothetical protein